MKGLAELISRARWYNRRDAVQSFAEKVMEYLDTVPKNSTLSATKLMLALGGMIPGMQQALFNARTLVPDFSIYWRHSKTKLTSFKNDDGTRRAAIEYLGQGDRTLAQIRSDIVLAKRTDDDNLLAKLEQELLSLGGEIEF